MGGSAGRTDVRSTVPYRGERVRACAALTAARRCRHPPVLRRRSTLRYQDYIASPAWARRRARYFASHRRACACCNDPREIHLHHLSYDNMGAEPDVDLMPLCDGCHEIVHSFARRQPELTLREATVRAVAAMQKNRATAPVVSKPAFVPKRQRLTLEQRKKTPLTGRKGRLSGLPVRRVPVGADGRPRPR